MYISFNRTTRGIPYDNLRYAVTLRNKQKLSYVQCPGINIRTIEPCQP